MFDAFSIVRTTFFANFNSYVLVWLTFGGYRKKIFKWDKRECLYLQTNLPGTSADKPTQSIRHSIKILNSRACWLIYETLKKKLYTSDQGWKWTENKMSFVKMLWNALNGMKPFNERYRYGCLTIKPFETLILIVANETFFDFVFCFRCPTIWCRFWCVIVILFAHFMIMYQRKLTSTEYNSFNIRKIVCWKCSNTI